MINNNKNVKDGSKVLLIVIKHRNKSRTCSTVIFKSRVARLRMLIVTNEGIIN